jgi:hypothetical protein
MEMRTSPLASACMRIVSRYVEPCLFVIYVHVHKQHT